MAKNLTLVFDLSCSGFAAALDSEDQVLSRRHRSASLRNDDIATWLEECLTEAGGGFSSLNRIVVGIGPGSFTGIRIAMAFAQGLAFPRSLNLRGFSSLSALLLSRPRTFSGPVVAAIAANSGRFYVSQGLADPGCLMDAEMLCRLGNPGTVLLGHEENPAFDTVRSAFGGFAWVGDQVNFPALSRHAQAVDKGAQQPAYLQAPAAESRFNAP